MDNLNIATLKTDITELNKNILLLIHTFEQKYPELPIQNVKLSHIENPYGGTRTSRVKCEIVI